MDLLGEARNRRFNIDWSKHKPVKPNLIGKIILEDFCIDELIPFIDWGPFFKSWGLPGRYPEIFNKEKVGKEARRMFNEAHEMLEKIKEENMISPRGILGLFPANSQGDNIVVFTNDKRDKILKMMPMLRQQKLRNGKGTYYALNDFIAPVEAGTKDYIGTFAVTAGFGVDNHVKKLKAEGDEYNSIMFRLLADRLTEAFAELMHLKVRKIYWGYDPQESLNNEELIMEEYVGIRPAPGYPACPDHLLKEDIFELLDVENTIGISLTNNYVMKPVSSVCGFYFAYSDARYFNISSIGEDQLKDYARRRKMSVEEVEELFHNILN
jgi:5-methyltetrahydrofolate--homocysteine methyltransferase